MASGNSWNAFVPAFNCLCTLMQLPSSPHATTFGHRAIFSAQQLLPKYNTECIDAETSAAEAQSSLKR